MNKVQDVRTRSTFGERFSFARWWQTGNLIDETDARFVRALGYRSKATASNWRRMDEPLPTDQCEIIAGRTGVDALWLELGERGAAAAPPQFAKWLAAHRKGREIAEPAIKSGAPPEEVTAPVRPPRVISKATRAAGPSANDAQKLGVPSP